MNLIESSQSIKSFVRRTGRMTAAQRRGLVNNFSRFGLPIDQTIELAAVFGRETTCVLEIGFGMGASLITQAAQQKETDFLGVEVHPPGIGKLLSEIDRLSLSNIRVIQADALQVMNEALKPASINKVQLFFPDPWPKKKHHKRRLVQKPFIEAVLRILKHKGWLHMATDWQAYAEQMLATLSHYPEFINVSPTQAYVERPSSRPLTKFEHRAQQLAHPIFDLMFQRL